MQETIYLTIECECPVCGVPLNGCSPTDESIDEQPEAGDPTLCSNCGTVLVFDEEGKQVLPPEGFLDDFDPDVKEHILEVQATLRNAITRGLMC